MLETSLFVIALAILGLEVVSFFQMKSYRQELDAQGHSVQNLENWIAAILNRVKILEEEQNGRRDT